MAKQAPPIQYTVRGVPPEVDEVLRRRAAQRKQSLNELIVDELTHATVGRKKKSDFSNIAGKWLPDPEFDAVLASQRQIDPDKWK